MKPVMLQRILLFSTALFMAKYVLAAPTPSEEKSLQYPATDMMHEQAVAVDSALDRRLAIEQRTRYQPFVLTAHKPNYLLPIAYNSRPNQAPFDPATEGELDKTEIKFQFSTKFPIADNLLGKNDTLYFAYTNLSFWQAYNSDVSSPFRETNHEPELFMAFQNDWKLWGFTNRLFFIGVTHQSNGRSGEVSRSWNRIYADFIFARNNFYLSIKPWLRIEPGTDDDNPDIEHYMGHGEVRGVWATGTHTASLMLRNNFDADNRGAVELNYSFPMSRRVKWFVQYFEGYGESLIDYNARTTRLGLGIAMTDWL